MLIAEYDYDMDIKVQREEAKEEGIEQGRILGTANDIIELLGEVGEVPEALKNKIMKEKHLDVLRRWLKLAAKSETIEEFEKSVEK